MAENKDEIKTKRYLIYGALNGGFGGKDGGTCEYDLVYAKDEDDAEMSAWHKSCEVYAQYEGSHGLESMDECESEEEYIDFREMWLDSGVIKEVDSSFDLNEYIASFY